MTNRLAEIKARTNPNPNVDADRHWLIAEVERLEADQEHWRKGVALIASVFGMKYLACVAIYERVLEQTAKVERMEAKLSTEQHLTAVLTKDTESLRAELVILEAWQRGNIAAAIRADKGDSEQNVIGADDLGSGPLRQAVDDAADRSRCSTGESDG